MENRARTYRIPVVDDEDSICDILQYNLLQAGYPADTANSAEEALYKLKKHYDPMLLDIMPDGINGFKPARLPRDEYHNNIPIIFIFAPDTEPDILGGLDAGGDDYISKPFSVKEVLARVRAVISRSEKSSVMQQSPLSMGKAAAATEEEHSRQQKRIIANNLVIDCNEHRVYIKDKEIFLIGKERDYNIKAINGSLILYNDIVYESVSRNNIPYDSLPVPKTVRITIIDSTGEVLFDNTNGHIAENHLERKEMKEALEHGSGLFIVLSAPIRSLSKFADMVNEPEKDYKNIGFPNDKFGIVEKKIIETFEQMEGNNIKPEVLISSDLKIKECYSLVYSSLKNLIDNTVEHRGPNCRITIPAGVKQVSGEGGCKINFTYTDTGKCVDEKALPRLLRGFTVLSSLSQFTLYSL